MARIINYDINIANVETAGDSVGAWVSLAVRIIELCSNIIIRRGVSDHCPSVLPRDGPTYLNPDWSKILSTSSRCQRCRSISSGVVLKRRVQGVLIPRIPTMKGGALRESTRSQQTENDNLSLVISGAVLRCNSNAPWLVTLRGLNFQIQVLLIMHGPHWKSLFWVIFFSGIWTHWICKAFWSADQSLSLAVNFCSIRSRRKIGILIDESMLFRNWLIIVMASVHLTRSDTVYWYVLYPAVYCIPH